MSFFWNTHLPPLKKKKKEAKEKGRKVKKEEKERKVTRKRKREECLGNQEAKGNVDGGCHNHANYKIVKLIRCRKYSGL